MKSSILMLLIPTHFNVFLPQILLYCPVDHMHAAHTPAYPTLHQLVRMGIPVCQGCSSRPYISSNKFKKKHFY